ncbi:MAG: glycosyltransferase involved in cell wall biosynthesis [Chlamydiales bacterium]|jgi:glycosyltransferase involved in cell wall biosynthesis
MCAEHPHRSHRVLALEAWLGGSHASFLEAWQRHSEHEVQVEGLAPRHWKWRLSASAWEFGRRIGDDTPAPDLLFVTDYVDLSQLASFLPRAWSRIPRALYMHENQLTYPVDEGAPVDTSWGFKNILSCLAADRVVFNSEFHRREFAEASDALLRTLPKPNPRAELAEVLARAAIVGPGIDWEEIPLGPGAGAGSPLRVLFNHRWEHDKDPAAFLTAIAALRDAGQPVEIVALGQDFSRVDATTAALLEQLSDCIARRGFVEDRAAYLDLLGTCDVVVSTARHEFYGISILEALGAGCTPLVPLRLAYPEILPAELRSAGLYTDSRELVKRLSALAHDPGALRTPAGRSRIRAAVRPLGSEGTARKLDQIVSGLTTGHA